MSGQQKEWFEFRLQVLRSQIAPPVFDGSCCSLGLVDLTMVEKGNAKVCFKGKEIEGLWFCGIT